MTTREAAAFLRAHDQYLILTHRRPDGDTVGCAAALAAALRGLGKRAYILNNPEITASNAPYAAPYWAPADYAPQTVVSVDIAARSLLPDNAAPYFDRIALAIDHHPSFEGFGAQQCVDASRAACGEILYEILLALDQITPAAALPLYVAVATDTGCFVYTNTTANTHRVAAALIDAGIDYKTVNKVHFRTKTKKRLALEGAMLAGMELFDRDRTVIMTIPRALMDSVQATESDAEDLSALAGLVEGTDCAITLRELSPDEWKISLRTGGRVNATRACALLGGGGHAAAAGCTVRGALPAVKAKILAAIDEVKDA